MEKAAAFFGIAPRLIRGVSDSAGVLTTADLRVIRRRIADFERRFPQTGFTVALMAVSKDFPGATYAYWVFNRCNPAGELNQGSANRHVFLLVDTAGKGAWMTIGYGLEPFIGERHLRQSIEKGRPHFERAQYALGITAVLGETEKVFHEVLSALPKTYGLPRSEVRSPLESQTASAW
jgi:uncharacterized membrane protein YgcG